MLLSYRCSLELLIQGEPLTFGIRSMTANSDRTMANIGATLFGRIQRHLPAQVSLFR
jgi:hypothetical protein